MNYDEQRKQLVRVASNLDREYKLLLERLASAMRYLDTLMQMEDGTGAREFLISEYHGLVKDYRQQERAMVADAFTLTQAIIQWSEHNDNEVRS